MFLINKLYSCINKDFNDALFTGTESVIEAIRLFILKFYTIHLGHLGPHEIYSECHFCNPVKPNSIAHVYVSTSILKMRQKSVFVPTPYYRDSCLYYMLYIFYFDMTWFIVGHRQVNIYTKLYFYLFQYLDIIEIYTECSEDITDLLLHTLWELT